jgi:hypothetical protein
MMPPLPRGKIELDLLVAMMPRRCWYLFPVHLRLDRFAKENSVAGL